MKPKELTVRALRVTLIAGLGIALFIALIVLLYGWMVRRSQAVR